MIESTVGLVQQNSKIMLESQQSCLLVFTGIVEKSLLPHDQSISR